MKKEQQRISSTLEEIRFRTAILESLSWDESQLEALFLFLDTELSKNTNYKIIIDYIDDIFGKECCDIIIDIFKEESFLHAFRRQQ